MEWKHEDITERDGWFGRLHLSWPALFLAGWLLYEFTAQPGPAALLACAKFGWPEVRTAFWLRRVDPDRLRGRTCFWSYLTFGLWKVAMMATVSMIAIGFLSVILAQIRQQGPNNVVSPVLSGALVAVALGFGLSFPSAYIALWIAWRNGVRIWLGHAPSRARREGFWPPRHGRINAAPFVGFTTFIMTLWAIGLAVAAFLEILRPNAAALIPLVLGVIASALVPIVLYRVATPLFARSPNECWTVGEDEEVYQAPMAEERMNQV